MNKINLTNRPLTMEDFFPGLLYFVDEDGELASNKVPVQNISNRNKKTLIVTKTGMVRLLLESEKTGTKVPVDIQLPASVEPS